MKMASKTGVADDAACAESRLCSIQLFQLKAKDGNGAHGVLIVSCGGQNGWGELPLPDGCGGRPIDLVAWASFLQDLRRKSVAEALDIACRNRQRWGPHRTELVLRALNDLMERAAQVRRLERLFDESQAYYSVL